MFSAKTAALCHNHSSTKIALFCCGARPNMPSFLSMKDNPNYMAALLDRWGKHIQYVISEINPDFVMPLETKGAFILDTILDRTACVIPPTSQIVYPRAVDFFTAEQLSKSRFLVIDDTFVTGRTLRNTKHHLVEAGAHSDKIQLTALLDFSQQQDRYDDTFRETIFPVHGDTNYRTDEVMAHIEKEILCGKMPSTCDHLVFNAEGVTPSKYTSIVDSLSQSGKILNYYKRGSFDACALILDDCYDSASWPVPPKIRFWHDRRSHRLCLVPMAFPFDCESLPNHLHTYYDELLTILSSRPRFLPEGLVQTIDQAEAASMVARIDSLKYIKTLLMSHGVNPQLSRSPIRRHYLSLEENVGETLRKQYRDTTAEELLTSNEPPYTTIPFFNACKTIVDLLRTTYKDMNEGVPRQEFEHQGFTLNELIYHLKSQFTSQEVHASVDYCCDWGYIVPFYQSQDGRALRYLRTTEKPNRMLAELIGASIIYSQTQPCHEWLLDKTVAILNNTENATPSMIASTKGPYGDFCKIRHGEDSFHIWKNVNSSLWSVDDSRRSTRGVTFTKNSAYEKEVQTFIKDPRLKHIALPLQAITYLLRHGGYRAGVLLDILTEQYGGLDYLGFNLEQVITAASSRCPSKLDLERIASHLDGAKQKYEYICIETALDKSKEPLIPKLRRKITRLNEISMVRDAASLVLDSVSIFPDTILYEAYRDLLMAAEHYSIAARTANYDSLVSHLSKLGFLDQSSLSRPEATSATKPLLSWIYAFAARECSPDFEYKPHIFTNRQDGLHWVLGYDIKKAARENATTKGASPEQMSRSIKSMAKNWIVALGGYLTRDEVNSGDNEYGIFDCYDDAMQAACWMAYHAKQLSHTHPCFPSTGAIGIAVAQGEIKHPTLMGVQGDPLDILGHFLKDKLDEVAGSAGRDRHETFKSSDVWSITRDNDPPTSPWFIYGDSVPCKDGSHKLVAHSVKINHTLKKVATPWRHKQRPS